MPIGAAFQKIKIALLGVSPQELAALKQQQQRELESRTVVKPNRMFGASWTSDKVAQRNVVMMCESCWKRYGRWWKKAHYRPDWGWRYISDCDGCSTCNIYCTLFHAEEAFYEVLTQAHGRQPQP